MQKLTWDKSTVESLHKSELDGVVKLLITPIHAESIAEYLTRAYGDDSSLSINELGERLSKFDYTEKLQTEMGFLLFILSTELPE